MSDKTLCACGCGHPVKRSGRKYLSGHYAKAFMAPRIMRRCKWCNKSMIVPEYSTNEFCSRKCAAKYLRGGKRKVLYVRSICPICGSAYERTENEANKGRKVTCSYTCGIEATRRKSLKSQTGFPVTRETQRELILQTRDACEHCGWNEIVALLSIHHIDHDTRNGDPFNILLLCPTCHAKEHWRLKTGWFTNLKHGSKGKEEYLKSIADPTRNNLHRGIANNPLLD
jgi:HNH endonuclease